MTVHIIYPHRDVISSPDCIGRSLLNHLSKTFDVEIYSWDSFGVIHPKEGDVLIGHSHPLPFTIFRRSVKQLGWRRKILIEPFNCDLGQVGYIDDFIDDVDCFLAITGDYWLQSNEFLTYQRWLPKFEQLDMAVNRDNFPFVKSGFSPKGERRFVYIGNDHPGKNLDYLNLIAQHFEFGKFCWIGNGDVHRYPHIMNIGSMDFSTKAGLDTIRGFDCLVNVGRYDANPTTILEAMSWGLINLATPTSGYINHESVVNIPHSDVTRAVSIVNMINNTDDGVLMDIQRAGFRDLQIRYNWTRFNSKIDSAILSNHSPILSRYPYVPKISYPHMRRLLPRLILNNLKNIFGC